MENKTYFNKLRSLTKRKYSFKHHASNLKSYIDNNTIPKGLNVKLTPQTPGVKSTRFMKRWDDILFNCSFRLLQLLLSFSIYGYKQINSEINETFIKNLMSVTPEDMEVIQRRLSDIQRIEKQNFKAKQNKKFKRDRLNQQSSVLEEEQILNMLKESKSKQPRKRRFKKQKHSVQDNLVVNLSSIELTDSEEKLLKDMEVIQRRLSDIQRIEKQNFKAKQNKKFKRDRLNQQSSVLEEEQILNMLKESKSKQPRKDVLKTETLSSR
ncbi:unnamed protein product [Mytilus coruscus]|uniref:Uncharacterized protein n=1 Tax=Mytilus coruscus TaxID=42192 RepID=A0A6J8CTB0_MYTCO|nr:unnamed protein product [Mytilus coruscus]